MREWEWEWGGGDERKAPRKTYEVLTYEGSWLETIE
jgi:hypothetical protein